jgi:23S rRNA (guanosine2251-2'-O)-methyltransferase
LSRLVAGLQPVREAIRVLGRSLHQVHLLGGPCGAASPALRGLERFARDNGVPVQLSSAATLDKLSGGAHHQGAVAAAPPLRLLDLEQLLAAAPTLLAALDRLSDPHNFGAAIRSSIAFGADAVLWPENAAAPLTPATFRASAGAVEHARLCRVPSLPAALRRLREAGMRVVGLASEAEAALESVDLSAPVVLAVGSEGSGLRHGVRNACDQLARLPASTEFPSLNASVALGIALYEARRQRRAAGGA